MASLYQRSVTPRSLRMLRQLERRTTLALGAVYLRTPLDRVTAGRGSPPGPNILHAHLPCCRSVRCTLRVSQTAYQAEKGPTGDARAEGAASEAGARGGPGVEAGRQGRKGE